MKRYLVIALLACSSVAAVLSLTFAREQGPWRLVFDQDMRVGDK